MPKLKGHIGTRVEAKAERMGLTRKAVAKFLGCDPSYLNVLYRGYSASHADAEGNPPAKPVPPSDRMAAKIRESLAKAAEATLKELAAKYPSRSLQVAPAACQSPKPLKANADADVPVVAEAKPVSAHSGPQPKPGPAAVRDAVLYLFRANRARLGRSCHPAESTPYGSSVPAGRA